MEDKKKGPCLPCTTAVIAAAAVTAATVAAVGQEMIDRAGEKADAEKGGPAKWNSNAFRNGWDSIFGKKQPVGEA